MNHLTNVKKATYLGKPLKQLPRRLHHNAYTTEDHEQTRHFYETILGLPLVAMYIEREQIGGEVVELGHAFYELGDGSALAFFSFADPAKQVEWRAKEQSLFVHIALLVEKPTQVEIADRLAIAGIKSFSIDHGFCSSLYVKDPNGLTLEFTVDPAQAPAIAAEMATTAHLDMRRWIAGDRRPNNRWRPDTAPADITL